MTSDEERAARHERASAEFLRSSKDALAEYERMLRGDELSGFDRRAVLDAVDLLKRQLACFAADEMKLNESLTLTLEVSDSGVEITPWT